MIERRTSAAGARQRHMFPGQRVAFGVEALVAGGLDAARRVPRPERDKEQQGEDQWLSPAFRGGEAVADHRDRGDQRVLN